MNIPSITISISKEELAQLPVARFEGEIIVVDKFCDVGSAVDYLCRHKIIGFDTETRPSFKKGVIHNVSLMQLSAGNRCYLFRLNSIGFPDELKNLLSNPDIKKIGASVHDDFHNLAKLQPFQPAGFIDVQRLVKAFHIADNSLARIYGILFSERMSKAQRLTNWEAETLTHAQLQYAALDAYACTRIYEHLMKGNFVPSLSPYIVEEHKLLPEK